MKNKEREETEWCHAANSVRFRCACGIIHNWKYGSRGKTIVCSCGRIHRREYASWTDSSVRRKYSKTGCEGLR